MRAKTRMRRNERGEEERNPEVDGTQIDAEERDEMLHEIIRIRTKAMQNIATIKAAPPELNLKPKHLEDIYSDIHNLAVMLERFLQSDKLFPKENAAEK